MDDGEAREGPGMVGGGEILSPDQGSFACHVAEVEMLRPGKFERKRTLGPVRGLGAGDVRELMSPEKPKAVMKSHYAVKRFRDSHHMIARLIASGLPLGEVGRRTGYSQHTVSIIAQNPAFQELITHYRELVTEAWVEGTEAFVTYSTDNMLKAERQLSDRLDAADEADETLPVRELIAITADRADRFGYGKHQTNLNVNADFASMLDKAIKRSGKVIENSPPTTESGEGSPPQPLPLPRVEASSGHAEAGSAIGVLDVQSPPAFRRRA